MIRNKTEKCLDSFQSCTATLSSNIAIPGVSTKRPSSLDDHGILMKLKAQNGRFRLWAANIGANLVTQYSLDYCLRDAPDVAEMIGHLLDIVSIRLARIEDPHLENPPDDAEDLSLQRLDAGREKRQSLTRQQDEIIEALVQDIGRLQSLSLAIRRPGGKYAMSRVSGTQMRETNTLTIAPESGQDTTPFGANFLDSVQTVVGQRFPKMDQSLRQHLALMIDLRRKRLIYARTHQNRYTSAGNKDLKPVPIVRHSTTALGKAESLDSQSESGPLYDSDLPDPPSIDENQTEHQCPFCGWTLLVEDLSKERWAQHVIHDLEPYICLDKACLPAQTAFARMEDWIAHTHQEHTLSWKCPLEHSEDQGDVGQDLLFSSQVDLNQHLVIKHEFPSSKARTIARRSAFSDPRRVFQTCPFCEWLPVTYSSDIERSRVHDESLEYHMAQHLVSLSSMALSRGGDLSIEGVGVEESKVLNSQTNERAAPKSEDHQVEQITAPPIGCAFVALEKSISKPPSPPVTLDQVQIGWISALPIEALVAEIMFDEPIEQVIALSPTNNTYTYGRIKIAGTKAYHIVAIAQLSLSTIGEVSPTTVANDMRRTFSNLKFSIMVGVASGIWTAEVDVRLGNIVVGVPDDGGIQYDRDRVVQEREFSHGNTVNKAPDLLRSAAGLLRKKHMRMLGDHGSQMNNNGTKRHGPHIDGDNLISAAYVHQGGKSCENCNQTHLRDSFHRTDLAHRVHYGAIASGDPVNRDVSFAERIQRTHNVVCFEMEGAGLGSFPCLVVRGISDHVNTHKNDYWHAYAASAAAAYAKELLSLVPLTAVAELTSKGNVHCNVPRTLNPLFTGRQALLDSMRDYLITERPREDRSVFVLQGAGGAGKSEAAIKFATEYQDSFWGIFWIDAYNRQSIEQGFAEIAKLQGPPLEGTDPKDVIEWLTTSEESWLLILDNCDDAETEFSKYIPSGGGSVILTTRTMSCRDLGRWANIDELEKEDGTRLLLAASGLENGDHKALMPITETVMSVLGRHALALVQAGTYIKSGFCTLGEYVQLFRDEQKRLKESTPEQQAPQYGSVYTTFEIAAKALASSGRHDSHLAFNLLNILAFLDGEAVEEDLFVRAFDQCHWIEKCWNLTWQETECEQTRHLSVAIGEYHESPSMYNVLDGRTGVFCEWQGRYAKNRGTDLAYPSEMELPERSKDTRRLSDLGSNQPHLPGSQQELSGHPPNAGGSSLETSSDQMTLGDVPAEDNRDAQGLLADTNVRDGNDDEADADQDYLYDMWHCERLRSTGLVESWKLSRLRTAYEHLSKLGLIDVNDRNISMNSLVREWARTRLDSTSRTVASQQARSVFVLSSFLPHDDKQLRDMEASARTHLGHGRHAQAAALLEDICRMKTLVFPSDDPGRLRDMIRLAHAYHETGRLNEAAALLQGVVEIDASSLPPNQARRSTNLGKLAFVYLKLNKPSEAVSLLEKVVEMDESSLLPLNDKGRRAAIDSLAKAYLMLGKPSQAIPLLEKVVEMDESSLLPLNDKRRRAAIDSLADSYLQLNKPTQAITLLRKEIKIRRRLPDDPERLSSMKKLAEAYLDLDNPGKAVVLLKRIVRLEAAYLAPDDPERFSSMDRLAEAFLELDKPFQAVTLLEEVVEINRMNSTQDDLGRLIVIDRLADAYLELGRPSQAAPLLEEVVTFESSHLAEENTSRLMSVRRLAQAYTEIGTSQKVKKAVSLLEEVMDKGRTTLHATSAELIYTRDLLIDARDKLRKTEQQLLLIHLMHLTDLKQERDIQSLRQLGR